MIFPLGSFHSKLIEHGLLVGRAGIFQVKENLSFLLFLKKKISRLPRNFIIIGSIIKSKVSCRYLGLMIKNKLKFDSGLNKMLIKLATSIRSVYFVTFDTVKSENCTF